MNKNEVHEQATKAKFEEFHRSIFEKKTPDGWYSHDLFTFGDYFGCHVEQANIVAIWNWATENAVFIPVIHGGGEEIIEAMEQGSLIISISLSYWTEVLLFNMPLIKELHPNLYDDLLGIEDYPVFNEDTLSLVAEERIEEVWRDIWVDVLKEVYERSPDKSLVDFVTWKDRVTNVYNETELLWIFRRGRPEDNDGDNFCDGDEYIEQETGRNVYFRTEERGRDGMLTPPMQWLIEATMLYTLDEQAKLTNMEV